MSRKIVIIGTNAAGSTAASYARKTDRKADITLIDSESYSGYSRCGLPFVLSGEILQFEDLVVFPLSWYKMMKLDVRLNTEAKQIDSDKKIVKVEKDGEEEILNYDSLILATGAKSFIPPIRGYQKRGVFSLRSINDGVQLENRMKNTKSVGIVGAGLIGLEMAHAFKMRKIDTTVVEMLPCVCPRMLDPDMAKLVFNKISEHGVNIITGQAVEEITGNDEIEGIKVRGKIIEVDTVLMASGVRARTELAQQIGAQLGVTRGVKVTNRMATTVPDVYACGDCVESYNMIDWQPVLSQLGTTATRQAKIAGVNAAGGYSIFPGVLGSVVSSIFGFEVGATGFTNSFAQKIGYSTVVGAITSKTRAEYFPGGKDIHVKIVVEKDFGRVIGGQIVAGEEVTQRINMISAAIQKQMTVFELAKADTAYAPPLNVTVDPVTLAAELAAEKFRRKRR